MSIKTLPTPAGLKGFRLDEIGGNIRDKKIQERRITRIKGVLVEAGKTLERMTIYGLKPGEKRNFLTLPAKKKKKKNIEGGRERM